MLQQFYEDFITSVPLQMPELMDRCTMKEPVVYEDYMLLTFPVASPYSLEEVMDMLEDDMELILLYHHIPSAASKYGHSCCAYSNPSFGHMYKVNAKTNDSGHVEDILVTIYDSLEYMLSDVCVDLELHSKSGRLKYQKRKEEVLLDFM